MTRLRWCAIQLLSMGGELMPAARREWLRDMRAELDYLKSDVTAVRWALGCVLACANARVAAMLNSNGKISRPVLMLEWLMCFLPLTLLWGVAVAYIMRFGPTADLLVATAFGTLGPIALVVAMFATVSQSRRNFGRLPRLLAFGFTLMAALKLLSASLSGKLRLDWFQLDLSVFVLLYLLPLAGALHLVLLSRGSERTAATS